MNLLKISSLFVLLLALLAVTLFSNGVDSKQVTGQKASGGQGKQGGTAAAAAYHAKVQNAKQRAAEGAQQGKPNAASHEQKPRKAKPGMDQAAPVPKAKSAKDAAPQKPLKEAAKQAAREVPVAPVPAPESVASVVAEAVVEEPMETFQEVDTAEVAEEDVDAQENSTEADEAAEASGNMVYQLLSFNLTSPECQSGCSPSGVPYNLIRQRPALVVTKTPKESQVKKAAAGPGQPQVPYHSPSGVSYESIRNRPKVDFKKTAALKAATKDEYLKQKPYHTESGIPYADIRKRTPLPDWYYTKQHRSQMKEKTGPMSKQEGIFAPADPSVLRPVDESLYTDPVLLGKSGDFTDGPLRNREYLRKTLHLNSKKQRLPKSLINTVILRLKEIYHKSIEPLETLFKFEEMGEGSISEATISAKPMVLFLGPWSTGKSTMINWFVGLPKSNQLYTGTQPTTSEFTAIMAGDHPRSVEGIVLAADSKQPFSGLEKFGTGFLEKFRGIEYPSQLLERVTLVDTPGIIENRHKQERGYPFNDIMQWFIDRSHLIVLVFDPTKLDVGSELETLFNRLKGRESQVRLLLNKADSISMQELMRVYGALFWNLAPLMNVTEPPRVYTGSCWWKPMQTKGTNEELFLSEEMNLLNDINDVIENQLHNKVAALRKHAVKVRTHALLVDRYLHTVNKNKNNAKFQVQDMIEKPEKFNIFKYVQHHANVSKYDLPSPDKYRELFENHPLVGFRSLESLCTMFNGCPIDIIEDAIGTELPNLLNSINEKIKEHQNPTKASAAKKSDQSQNSTATTTDSTKSSTTAETNKQSANTESTSKIHI